MMNKDSTTIGFQGRINGLRYDILRSIRTLLIENNLTELELPSDTSDEHTVHVVWSDDDGNFYDSPVTTVSLDKDGVSIFVEDIELNVAATLDETELWVNHFGWLCDLRESIIETLKTKQ